MRKEFSGSRTTLAFLGFMIVAIGFWYMTEARFTKPEDDGLTDIGPNTLEQLTSLGKPGVVEFYITNCIYCAKIAPELKEIEEKYGDVVFVVKMHAEKYPSEAAKYGIQAFPTLVYFDASGTPKAVVTGYVDAPAIEAKLKELDLVR